MDNDDDLELVTWKLLKKLGWPYSRQHTWRLIAQGRFPQPIKFGAHRHCRVAWRKRSISRFFKDHDPQP